MKKCDEKKTAYIQARVTPNERDEVVAVAGNNQSEFIRNVVLVAVRGLKSPAFQELALIIQRVEESEEMRKNEIINSINSVHEDTINESKQMISLLMDIRIRFTEMEKSMDTIRIIKETISSQESNNEKWKREFLAAINKREPRQTKKQEDEERIPLSYNVLLAIILVLMVWRIILFFYPC